MTNHTLEPKQDHDVTEGGKDESEAGEGVISLTPFRRLELKLRCLEIASRHLKPEQGADELVTFSDALLAFLEGSNRKPDSSTGHRGSSSTS